MRLTTDFVAKHAPPMLAAAFLLFSALSLETGAQEMSANAADLQSDKPTDDEAFYKLLLSSDTTGDSYAGLAVVLCRQGKLSEAEDILRQARDNEFSSNPKLLAAAGFVAHAHAAQFKDFTRRDLYFEMSETLCKRALQADPGNKLALETLIQVEKSRRNDAKLYNDLHETNEPITEGDFGSNQLFFLPGARLTNHKESTSQANGKAQ